MPDESLDAFLARCDDVLHEWNPPLNSDAMRWNGEAAPDQDTTGLAADGDDVPFRPTSATATIPEDNDGVHIQPVTELVSPLSAAAAAADAIVGEIEETYLCRGIPAGAHRAQQAANFDLARVSRTAASQAQAAWNRLAQEARTRVTRG